MMRSTFLWILLATTPAWSAESLPAESSSAAGGGGVGIAVPVATDWAAGLLVLIVWLLVAAVLLGPLLRRLKLYGRSTQVFAEDLVENRKA
jgi:hypothetical protein